MGAGCVTTIKLDGMPIDGVIAYSVDHGWLIRPLLDSAGRKVRQGEGFASERLTGTVEVCRAYAAEGAA